MNFASHLDFSLLVVILKGKRTLEQKPVANAEKRFNFHLWNAAFL